MITERTFTKDWLIAVNRKLGWNRQEAQLKNLEKAIAALYLLESLAGSKLNFIFKGGTSLILLLRKIYRLSVDIDILAEEPKGDLDGIFAGICSQARYSHALSGRNVKLTTGLTSNISSFFIDPSPTRLKSHISSWIITGQATYTPIRLNLSLFPTS